MNQKFQNALKNEPQQIPPIWFMRQAGRYHSHYQNLRKKHSFVDLCKQPDLAAETAMGPIRDFDFDAAILFSDILFPLEALGMGLSYDNGPPKLGFALQDISQLPDRKDAHLELHFQGQGVKATRALLPKNKSLIGFVGGPFTLFVYAVEGSHHGGLTKAKALTPKLFPPFCDKMLPLLEYTIEEQLKNGAEIVMIFDTAAGELNPAWFDRFNAPVLERLLQKFPKKLGYYGKHLTHDHLARPFYTRNDLAGFGIDHRFSLAKILSVPHSGFVQGNFDQTLLHLDPAQFEIEAKEFLAPIKDLPLEKRNGWIMGLGHGVLPATPERNVKRLIELVRSM